MPTYEEIIARAKSNPSGQFDLRGLMPSLPITDTLTSIYPTPDVGSWTATGQEWINLVRILANDFYVRYQQRDIRVFQSKFPQVAITALVAKQQLSGLIGNISSGDIIPQAIRPVTVYAQTGTTTENWIKASVSAGWASPAITIDLNTTSSTISISPQNRVVMVILGLADGAPGAPKLFEYQFKDSAGVPLEVHSIPWIHLGDNYGLQIWELGQAILVDRNSKVTLDLNYESGGQSNPTILGVQFVKREYATAE